MAARVGAAARAATSHKPAATPPAPPRAHRPPQRRPGCRCPRRTRSPGRGKGGSSRGGMNGKVGRAPGAVARPARGRNAAHCGRAGHRGILVVREGGCRRGRPAMHLLAGGGLQGDLVGLDHQLGGLAGLHSGASGTGGRESRPDWGMQWLHQHPRSLAPGAGADHRCTPPARCRRSHARPAAMRTWRGATQVGRRAMTALLLRAACMMTGL